MDIDVKELVIGLKAIAEEKNMPQDVVHDILEQALAAAWRRDHGDREQNIEAKLDITQGTVDIFVIYDVVAEVEDDAIQLTLKEAQVRWPDAQVGQSVRERHQITSLGRVAAQTAKQVILQKLRETEKEMVLNEYANKIGTIMMATILRVDPRLVICEIGRVRGIMPLSEQINGETYQVGDRIRVLLKEIDRTGRESQLILNRSGADFLRLLFEREVPEIGNGAVQIKGIAREGGVRSKVAVSSSIPNVDPVGTLIGTRGTRVQVVNNEVGSQEKIDIVVWHQDDKQYIINALSSTEMISVTILRPTSAEQPGRARVVVAQDQLSVAIGRLGQNVRLAGKLTGYEIDIIDEVEATASKPPVHKLQKKTELEEDLMKAVKETQTE